MALALDYLEPPTTADLDPGEATPEDVMPFRPSSPPGVVVDDSLTPESQRPPPPPLPSRPTEQPAPATAPLRYWADQWTSEDETMPGTELPDPLAQSGSALPFESSPAPQTSSPDHLVAAEALPFLEGGAAEKLERWLQDVLGESHDEAVDPAEVPIPGWPFADPRAADPPDPTLGPSAIASHDSGVELPASVGELPRMATRPIAPNPLASAAVVVQPAPASEAPVSEPYRPAIPFDLYARIKVAIWRDEAKLLDVLEEHGIEETAWRLHEVDQALAIARESREGETRLARRLRRAFSEARAARPLSDDTMPLAQYAALRAALEGAQDPNAVLQTHGLEPKRWQRHKAAWARRARADATLARSIRRALASARRRSSEPPPASGSGGDPEDS